MELIREEELGTIVGGNNWGNAVNSAMKGAARGIGICSPLGPWGMAGCGVVGGLAGGYVGYHKKSIIKSIRKHIHF